MAPSVRISRKSALALVAEHDSVAYPETGASRRHWEELRGALEPKRSAAPARKRKAAKKRTKKEETKAIRDALFERSHGHCECCGNEHQPLEVDHFFGRVRVRQSDKTCWLLCIPCHRLKTLNRPDAAHWLNLFANHCARHGYGAERMIAERRLDSIELSRQAEERAAQ